jgi:hypothetical protein
MDLRFEFDAAVPSHFFLNQSHQGQDIGGCRPADIDQKIGMVFRYPCPADLHTLEPAPLDQAAGAVVFRIFEKRSGVSLTLRLIDPPLFLFDMINVTRPLNTSIAPMIIITVFIVSSGTKRNMHPNIMVIKPRK